MTIEIFTDGSCDPNPGPGGWGFAVYRGAEEIFADRGGEPDTTNNRMEMTALLAALNWLDPKRPAIVWTDSRYVVDGATSWRHGWKKAGWKRGQKPLANDVLWQILDQLLDTRLVEVLWTRGHDGTVGNERADELAEEGRQSVVGFAQSGRASEACPVRAGSRARKQPVVNPVQRQVSPSKADNPARARPVRGDLLRTLSEAWNWPDGLHPLRDHLAAKLVDVHAVKSARQALFLAKTLGKVKGKMPKAGEDVFPALMAVQRRLCPETPRPLRTEAAMVHRQHGLGTFGPASGVRRIDPATYKIGGRD